MRKFSDIEVRAPGAMDEVLTTLEVANFFRVHATTIQKMAKSGKLPGFKMGSDWRFRRAAIEKWLQMSVESTKR